MDVKEKKQRLDMRKSVMPPRSARLQDHMASRQEKNASRTSNELPSASRGSSENIALKNSASTLKNYQGGIPIPSRSQESFMRLEK